MQRPASAPRVEPGALELDADGAVLAPRYGDVYASRDGALGQAQHVFLAGNGLPQRWVPALPFTILETGFGLGINFLATWQAWRVAPRRCARLHYVAVERHPLSADALERAVPHTLREQFAPLFQPLLAQLIGQWPEAIGGLHRLAFDDGRVLLTLALGDAATLVPQLVAGVDGFYLDGFAPERNPQMWSPALLKAVARLARPGATLATWCTARPVRDALAAAGFELELQPGFGRKRNMLRGRYAPRWTVRRHEPPAPHAGERRALVIGAGLAGALAADALARRDWSVTVLDAANAPAQGASALPWGLLHPHVSRDDNRASQLERAGFRLALQALARSDAAPRGRWRSCGVFELASDVVAAQAERVLHEFGLPPSLVRWLDAAAAAERVGALPRGGGWWYGQGGSVAVRDWCADLLAHPRIRFCRAAAVVSLERTTEGWSVRGVPPDRSVMAAPVAIVAAAAQSARLLGARHLPLQAIGGRISRLSAVPGLRAALAGAGTLVPGDDEALLGATFEAAGEAPLDEARAHQANLARLPRLLARPPEVQWRGTFAGERSAARDRQPYAGAVADEQAALAGGARLSGAQLDDVPRRAGLYVSAAFGSRGLLLAPLAAELLAAQIEGEPWPVERPLAAALDPARVLLRALRRLA